jgi:hypothetical protein
MLNLITSEFRTVDMFVIVNIQKLLTGSRSVQKLLTGSRSVSLSLTVLYISPSKNLGVCYVILCPTKIYF